MGGCQVAWFCASGGGGGPTGPGVGPAYGSQGSALAATLELGGRVGACFTSAGGPLSMRGDPQREKPCPGLTPPGGGPPAPRASKGYWTPEGAAPLPAKGPAPPGEVVPGAGASCGSPRPPAQTSARPPIVRSSAAGCFACPTRSGCLNCPPPMGGSGNVVPTDPLGSGRRTPSAGAESEGGEGQGDGSAEASAFIIFSRSA